MRMTNNSRLEEKLLKIYRLFDKTSVTNHKQCSTDIVSYYKRNILPYYIFHNKEGFVHMGISDTEKYSKTDVLKQPIIVSKYIEISRAKNVLELACGKGANLNWLAKEHPKVGFTGIDLPGGQISEAFKINASIENIKTVEGDYHNLTVLPENSFDVVFVIEALCHSNHKNIVAKQVFRILKPGGYFIVFDGYLSDDSVSNETVNEAVDLTQKSMAVDHFEKYKNVKSQMLSSGFILVEERDYSTQIIPTLRRFEKLARLFFFFITLGKAIKKIVSEEFAKNAIAGYLMPDLLNLGVAKYYLSVYQKPKASCTYQRM